MTLREHDRRVAEHRFREKTDTREDRDVLRAFGVDWMTVVGGKRRDVPTEEEEDAPDASPETDDGSVPKIWKSSKNRAPGKGKMGEPHDG